MTSALYKATMASIGMTWLPAAYAVCNAQSVVVSSGNVEVAHYEVLPSEIHRLALSNGFTLGLKIEPASAEKTQEIARKSEGRAPAEWVKISLFDLRNNPPKELTHTWGPTNSFQSYGPAGGADRVTEIGESGIELKLSKPKCTNSAS